MTLTGENELVRILMPAAQAIRPGAALLQQKAVARAITQDGYIDPSAMLPGVFDQDDFATSSTTASSSDAVNPVIYLARTFTLPQGTWSVKAKGGITGRLSTSSNLNTYIDLNGQRSDNFQVPLVAGDTGVAWPSLTLAEVSGDVTLALLFRPSAGTLTVEAGFWEYKARRIG